MNQIEIFQNPEFGAIRAVEIDGEPWLVGKDVSLALGYTNPQKAIRDHVDAEDRTVNDSFTVNGTAITLINESGLYSLVMSSKLPKAKQFRRWVTSEVLPTIRKHGAYITREKLWEVATSPEALMKLCSDLLAEREENAVLREENALLESKAAFYDLFIDLNHSTNLRTTAKELVVPERRFVRFLLEQRFVYRTASGNVLPYAKPSNDGLFCVKDYCNHGHVGSYTLVTPQGKLYFAQLREMIAVHKESKEQESLTLTKGQMAGVLRSCGVAPEHTQAFTDRFDETFGPDAQVSPRNLIDTGKVEVRTPDVVVQVNPERGDLVRTEMIQGCKYIMIRVDGEVEVNGVEIHIG